MPLVHVLYENEDWLPPLEAGLQAEGLEYRLHEVWRGSVESLRAPEPGIYWNRMSPSSHTRGHLESVGLTAEWLAWLEHHGRRVLNGSRAFALEVSKLRQALALNRYGIVTPRTVLAVGKDEILRAANTFDGPFITKHNQGGKGLGIRLFDSTASLKAYVDSEGFDAGPRGQLILQQYIEAREPFITRVEIVGDRFLYALQSDTSGGFELCPADACELPAQAPDVCPADGSAKFKLAPISADDPLVRQYLALTKGEGIDLAGIEFVEDRHGVRYTYDINGTTNYNSAVGRAAGIDGMREAARYLKRIAAASHPTELRDLPQTAS
ncbi:MAG: alpha-L-glutamate ligase [Myxococcales bacterium]|nr:alpha-L-glutamate ligase [Myxococcales bacterium]